MQRTLHWGGGVGPPCVPSSTVQRHGPVGALTLVGLLRSGSVRCCECATMKIMTMPVLYAFWCVFMAIFHNPIAFKSDPPAALILIPMLLVWPKMIVLPVEIRPPLPAGVVV